MEIIVSIAPQLRKRVSLVFDRPTSYVGGKQFSFLDQQPANNVTHGHGIMVCDIMLLF